MHVRATVRVFVCCHHLLCFSTLAVYFFLSFTIYQHFLACFGVACMWPESIIIHDLRIEISHQRDTAAYMYKYFQSKQHLLFIYLFRTKTHSFFAWRSFFIRMFFSCFFFFFLFIVRSFVVDVDMDVVLFYFHFVIYVFKFYCFKNIFVDNCIIEMNE